MKKIFGLSACLLAFIAIMPVAAQTAEGGSPLYYVSVPVEKVFAHSRGYIIDYRTGYTGTNRSRVFIPLEWFEDSVRLETQEAPKADLVFLRAGNRWPYLSVFYKDGEFSHIRLYLRYDRTHETWGNVRNINLDAEFDGVEEIRLLFGGQE